MASEQRPFSIVTVCTMNICRSPALEVVFRRELIDAVEAGQVVVSSGGTHAFGGALSCDISLAMVGETKRERTAQLVTKELLEHADLIITAETRHIENVLTLAPDKGGVVFTARQAARVAPNVEAADDLRDFVRKLDELRNDLPSSPSEPRALPHDPDDIPDPHVVGYNVHRMSADYILKSVNAISEPMNRIIRS